MNKLSEKSTKTLELGAVLELLSAEASSIEAKESALSLVPTSDMSFIKSRLMECSDAKALVGRYGSPSFSGTRNMQNAIQRAAAGGILNMRELLDIAALLLTADAVSRYASEKNERTSLDPLFSALNGDRHLTERIASAIISEEEMADKASGELYEIRKQIRLANAKIRDTLSKIISSPSYQKILQDSIVTMRGERYVVPVKAEHKSAFPGLVHDVSSSGATIFIEPLPVVELNNKLRLLAAEEKKEIERILLSLSSEVAENAEIISEDFRALCSLDLIFAKASLSYKMKANEPQITQNGVTVLRNARHPLLDKKTAVPIDIRLGGEFDTLIITGPNTGGKTVSLKTLGLLSLMTECGLHIPVDDRSSVAVYDHIYADIGDEQSIEQSLSTFSSHMKNIIGILQEAERNSLVLMDELGAGTDPIEGAALAISIIEHLRAKGAKIAATTHYAEIKSFALTTNGVENASCEFNVETLRPTYRLLIGVPGKSNAFAISKRLGLPEHIIARAEEHVGTESTKFEEVLNQLESERQKMEKVRQKTEELKKNAEIYEADGKKRLIETEKEAQILLERAKKEASTLIEDAKNAVEETYNELSELRKKKTSGSSYDNLSEARAMLAGKLNTAMKKTDGERRRMKTPSPGRPIVAGDVVELVQYGNRATVLTPPDSSGNLTLQAGILKINAKLSEVRLLENAEVSKKTELSSRAPRISKTAEVRTELDLRGKNAEEALMELDQFIDGAILLGLHSVTVIHGKGTGVLRSAVQEHLKKHRQVKQFRLGRYGEGETGVTIVEI
ncbi:MAG: endonuclease MutS2 [Clostridiales bacterium]|nr:endonuclease MutS2 [Clostridiales bacterium]